MRIGRFKIQADILTKARTHEFTYQQLSMLFSHGMIIIGVLPREDELRGNWYEYIALWDKFNEVPEGEGIPFYDLIVDTVYNTLIPRVVIK